MPKKKGKKKAKKKSSKSSDERQTSMQVGGIPNRTMIQHMASETLSVAGSSRSGISSTSSGQVTNEHDCRKGNITHNWNCIPTTATKL